MDYNHRYICMLKPNTILYIPGEIVSSPYQRIVEYSNTIKCNIRYINSEGSFVEPIGFPHNTFTIVTDIFCI